MTSKYATQASNFGKKDSTVATKRSSSPSSRHIGDHTSVVPKLHAGLLDLIRTLGKLAHSASRTTILCEPFIPIHSSKTFHKNCGLTSPENLSVRQQRSKPTLTWNPVQTTSYYYNCYNYRNFPERDSNYQEIDEQYKQIKQKTYTYDPPVCDEEKIKKIISDPSLKHKENRDRIIRMAEQQRSSEQVKKEPSGLSVHSGIGYQSESEADPCDCQSSMSSSKKSHKMTKSTADRRKSEVEKLRDMIQRLEHENLTRYQEMLTLMRDISRRDFCRATCGDEANNQHDGDINNSQTGIVPSKTSLRSESQASSSNSSMKLMKNAHFNNDLATTSGSSLALDSNESLELQPEPSTKNHFPGKKSSEAKRVEQAKSTGNLSCPDDDEVTLEDLIEMSDAIADVVVLESVKELMNCRLYKPPSNRTRGESMERGETGTAGSPFEKANSVKLSSKSIGSKQKVNDDQRKSSGRNSAPNAPPSLPYNEDTTVSREPFGFNGQNVSKKTISTAGGSVSAPSKNTITKGTTSSRDRPGTQDSNGASGSKPKRPTVSSSQGGPSGNSIVKDTASSREPYGVQDSYGTSTIGGTSKNTLSNSYNEQKPKKTSASSDRSSAKEPKSNICRAPCAMRQQRGSSEPSGSKSNPNCPKHGNCSDTADSRLSRGSKPSQNPNSPDSQKYGDDSSSRRSDHQSSPGRNQYLTRSSRSSSPKSPAAKDDTSDGTTLYFARATKNAFPPQKETCNAAGFMLRSAYDYTIPPRSPVAVKTDLIIELPPKSYGRLAPRNCLVRNFGLDVIGDVIDRDYDDVVTVVLLNHLDTSVPIKRGAKIALLICESIYQPQPQEKSDTSQKQ